MAFENGHVIAMKSVNIAELKNRLSHYLRQVRRGESILVRDRDTVIARIEPVRGPAADEDERIASLIARGVLTRGAPITPELFRNRPRISADVVAALLKDREEGF